MTQPDPTATAERAVLGAMMLSADAIGEVIEVVTAADFYRGAHRTIFEAIVAIHTRDEPVDAVLVGDELERAGRLDDVGGHLAVTDIMADTPTAANARYYAGVVAGLAVRRRIRDAAGELLTYSGEAPSHDPDELLHGAETILARAGARDQPRLSVRTMADLAAETRVAYTAGGDAGGTDAPFTALNYGVGRLRAGELILIGGASMAGKTLLALQAAVFAASAPGYSSAPWPSSPAGSVFIASPAQPGEHVWVRCQRLRKAYAHTDPLVPAAEDLPITVDDGPMQTPRTIRAAARRVDGLRLIVVDYLHLLDPAREDDTRALQVAKIGRDLKLLARDLHVPVVAVSQLSRAPQRRSDPRPRLGDLRDSGALETDADQVWLLHATQGELPGPVDLIVAKNRWGRTGTVELVLEPRSRMFSVR